MTKAFVLDVQRSLTDTEFLPQAITLKAEAVKLGAKDETVDVFEETKDYNEHEMPGDK